MRLLSYPLVTFTIHIMPFRVGLPAIALSLLCNTASAVTWNTTTGQGLTFNAGSVAPSMISSRNCIKGASLSLRTMNWTSRTVNALSSFSGLCWTQWLALSSERPLAQPTPDSILSRRQSPSPLLAQMVRPFQCAVVLLGLGRTTSSCRPSMEHSQTVQDAFAQPQSPSRIYTQPTVQPLSSMYKQDTPY